MPAVVTTIVAMALAMTMVVMAMVVLVMSERSHHPLPHARISRAVRRALVRTLRRIRRRPRPMPSLRPDHRKPAAPHRPAPAAPALEAQAASPVQTAPAASGSSPASVPWPARAFPGVLDAFADGNDPVEPAPADPAQPTPSPAQPPQASILWIAQASLSVQTAPPAPAGYAERIEWSAESPAQPPLDEPVQAREVEPAPVDDPALNIAAAPEDAAGQIESPTAAPLVLTAPPLDEPAPARCVQTPPAPAEPKVAPMLWAAQAFTDDLDAFAADEESTRPIQLPVETPAPPTPAATRLAEPVWPLRAHAVSPAAEPAKVPPLRRAQAVPGVPKAPADFAGPADRPVAVRTVCVPRLPDPAPALRTPLVQPAPTTAKAPSAHKAHKPHTAHKGHKPKHAANGSFFKGVGRLIAYILGRPVAAPAPEAFFRTSVIHPAQTARLAQASQPQTKATKPAPAVSAPQPSRPAEIPAETSCGVDLSAPDPLLD